MMMMMMNEVANLSKQTGKLFFLCIKENAMIQSAYLKQTCDVMWRLPSKLHKEVVKGHYDDGR